MSSGQERQTGTSGSTMGYDKGQAEQQARGQMPAQPQGRDYPTTEREVQVRGRHEVAGYRGAVIGFTALAGTMMLLGGLWMVTVAIVALTHGAVFTTAPAYTFRFNIVGWGWLQLGLGVLVFAAGMCLFLGMAWARYTGAFIAGLSAIANFAFIPYQPAWSIIMIALDAFIIWALLAPRRLPSEF